MSGILSPGKQILPVTLFAGIVGVGVGVEVGEGVEVGVEVTTVLSVAV